MKAIALTRYLPIDHPESLVDVELPDPVPGPHDLVVAVRAVSVNPVDHKVRAPKPDTEAAPRVLGWDAAGVVAAVGPAVTRFAVGDEVYYAGSIVRPGCDSELHAVDERIVGRKPLRLGFGDAAALPLTSLTAWELLFDRLGISPTGGDGGKRLLVIGAAGGVGSIAIQLAVRLARLEVVGTASRPESAAWARRLGAGAIIDHSKPLADELGRAGGPVDYIVCFTDPALHFAAFADLIKPQGKIGLIVGTGAPLPLGALQQKSITLAWEVMFTRSRFTTPDIAEQHAILNRVADLVDQGVLESTVKERYGKIDAANLRRAHRALETGHTTGKIVLEGFGG
jgi:zinc-binding alcohol dehydrogenase family protein